MFVGEQSNDELNHDIKGKVREGVTNRERMDERGINVRVHQVDLSIQIVVPEKLRVSVLYLAYHPKIYGRENVCSTATWVLLTFNDVGLLLDHSKLHSMCITVVKTKETQVVPQNISADGLLRILCHWHTMALTKNKRRKTVFVDDTGQF